MAADAAPVWDWAAEDGTGVTLGLEMLDCACARLSAPASSTAVGVLSAAGFGTGVGVKPSRILPVWLVEASVRDSWTPVPATTEALMTVAAPCQSGTIGNETPER